MNDMMSFGDVGGGCGGSENSACRGVEEDCPRAREKVCLIDANPPRLPGGDAGGFGGDGGRLLCVGDMGVPPRAELGLGVMPFAGGFFLFPPNDRRKDHSPSN